jgi:TonB-dependent receptor
VDSSSNFYRFGNYIVDATLARGSYNGSQKISALFGMFDLPLSAKLNFIGGLRLESTEILVKSQDTTMRLGQLSDQDLLPSVNLIYKLGEDANLRAVYGRTLARPTFRELAPYSSFDFAGDFIFTGNPQLQRTLIDNYDLRWEWYPRSGEILAISGFYKNLKNPIEKVIISVHGEYQYQNVEEAQIIGAEFEIRKQLDKFSSALKNFQLGANLTLAHSKVKIPAAELQVLRFFDPRTSDTRPLQGQSPFVLNLNLNYGNPKSQTVCGLYYNLFGRRLSDVSLGGTPNVYEHIRGLLDFTLAQGLWKGVTIKLGGKNLLNSTFTKAHTYKGTDYITEQHKDGRSFSVSLGYSLK